MPKLEFDKQGEHFFETGVEECVLYVADSDAVSEAATYPEGVAWNGITAITESPSGAEPNKQYADNQVYLNIRGAEEFGGTIEAFQYPEQFSECNGEAELTTGVMVGGQPRKTFGLCYKTKIGNDIDGINKGYKLHLVYGCTCSPSEVNYETINESPEGATMSWEFETVPVAVAGSTTLNKVSKLTIDSRKLTENKLQAIVDVLYGTDAAGTETGTTARLPLPAEVKSIINTAT